MEINYVSIPIPIPMSSMSVSMPIRVDAPHKGVDIVYCIECKMMVVSIDDHDGPCGTCKHCNKSYCGTHEIISKCMICEKFVCHECCPDLSDNYIDCKECNEMYKSIKIEKN
jgi:hypothetical protein